MSIASSFGNIKPSLLLDFANVGALDPRITFTRASTATYYDGVTTAKAEENLILQSQAFTTSPWAVAAAGFTLNNATAPDGTTTASTLTIASAAANGGAYQSTGITTSGVTLSIYAKAGTCNFVGIAPSSTNVACYANFNLSTGAVASSAGCTASITSVGNGWYRCVLANSTLASNGYAVFAPKTSDPAGHPWNNGTPTVGDSVLLWGAQLEQRSAVTAYTATTTQPITNYIPVLQTAAANVARFDHTPTTGEALGLLVEEQRTNLLTYSEQFDNAAWTKISSSITANTIVAPDGTLTGDKLIVNTGDTAGYVSQNISFTSGASYTVSCFVKQGEQTDFRFTFLSAAFGENLAAVFNLSTGTVTSTGAGQTATITPVGNGWYRCTATATATATASSGLQFRSAFTGNGYSGIYIWGAQLEVGAFPTSYTATTSAQVTRSADAASMTDTNFSSWYNQAEGTLYAESQLAIQSTTTRTVAAISDGTFNNFIDIRYKTTGISGEVITQNSVTQVNLSASVSAITANQSLKDAFAFDFNDAAASANNQSASTDTSCVIPLVNKIEFGVYKATNYLNGHISKLAFYPQRLTNAQLVALTS